MKKLVIGILAHVDAGKTTLSESMLYLSGTIRKLGRVDNQDAFLDTYALERERGITIFSKQAVLHQNETQIMLLDTPGHVDFSAEMERTLQVLDYAVLVISGADGVQGHTQTLWHLLLKYNIPVFLFINKMYQNGTDKQALLKQLKKRLSDGCVDFSCERDEAFYDSIAMCDENLLDEFLETEQIRESEIIKAIKMRQIFPCFFGSALKLQGIEEFLSGLDQYTVMPEYPTEFGAKVFKIARDEQGNRLTYLKMTGGSLKVRTSLGNAEEKINQIRIYSGVKYDAVNEVSAGDICAVTGLTATHPGEGYGIEEASSLPVLEPVLNYQILLPEGCDAAVMLPKLRQLEEEEPELHIVWDEELKEIHVQIMGEVQTEILKSIIQERFGVTIGFGTGNIVYKETIADVVEGIGHFEPLRHYAEVHLMLEPLPRGSGLVFAADCSEDDLDRNWQRLVLTHLYEREHKGVLTGAPITDMKITLVAGRAHIKHTEGGDFRQATYRAVRQGLMQASSILLEPYYEFRLEVPEQMIGRAMTDIEKMVGTFATPAIEDGTAVLCGKAPVVTMRDYQKEVVSYSKGHGRLYLTLGGYERCHNAEEVIETSGYDAERDLLNPTGSVFCSHGTGFIVPWNQVREYMHVEGILPESKDDQSLEYETEKEEEWIGTDEIDAILKRTFYANRKDSFVPHKGISGRKVKVSDTPVVRTYSKPAEPQEEYLLVDGYNVIFGCEDLNDLAQENMDGARGRLMDLLCNYQGVKKCNVILVFDAYRVQGHVTEIVEYHNIHVVYTKEAETADQYIEKFAHQNGHKYRVTVATSDGLEQVIIRSKGCLLMSARELREDIALVSDKMQKEFIQTQQTSKNYLLDSLSDEVSKHVERIRKGEDK